MNLQKVTKTKLKLIRFLSEYGDTPVKNLSEEVRLLMECEEIIEELQETIDDLTSEMNDLRETTQEELEGYY